MEPWLHHWNAVVLRILSGELVRNSRRNRTTTHRRLPANLAVLQTSLAAGYWRRYLASQLVQRTCTDERSGRLLETKDSLRHSSAH